jgi:23S rRNA G2069 N7-methylase RlmK/C1962 C5-methylase RlmI
VTPEKLEYQAEIFSNRVRARFRHFSRKYRKQNIECFRIYDRDIPEVRAVVDWYAGRVVIAEYERLQTGPDWLPRMARAVAGALGLAPEQVYLKRRRTKTGDGPRYTKLDSTGARFAVRERDLKFLVNLDDYLDTGLYSDHRDTRELIRKQAAGKNFLNLFACTGAFTCAAAAGGALSTVTVDRSATYLEWARENLELNGLTAGRHQFIQSDAGLYLEKAAASGERFTLAFVDPPSFFQDQRRAVAFDISRDHPQLISNVLKVMEPGSEVFFSTNHQRFEPRFEGLAVEGLKELTPGTIPEDYRNKTVHRCWRMTVGQFF